MTLWSHGFSRSCYKLKPLYIHYHKAYGHQTWQNGDLPWGFLFIKSCDCSIIWLCQNIWEIKSINSTNIMPIFSKIAKLTLNGSYPWSHMVMWSYDLTWSQYNLKTYPPTTISMATILDRVVASIEELLPLKSYDFWITWSSDYLYLHQTNDQQTW